MIDDYVVAYTGNDLDRRTIYVGVFESWLLIWVADEMNICTWCIFVLVLQIIELNGAYKNPKSG